MKIAWEQKQRRQRMVLAAQRARVVQRATQLGQAAAPEQADAAGLDEGLLSLCLPHSRLYGESL